MYLFNLCQYMSADNDVQWSLFLRPPYESPPASCDHDYPICYISHVNQPLAKDHMPYKTTIGLHIGLSLITEHCNDSIMWEAIKSYVDNPCLDPD